MQIYEIVYLISNKIYLNFKYALEFGFTVDLDDYIVILPKWLPQIFKQVDVIVIGTESYPYIMATTLIFAIIVSIVWYLVISITYKFFKKLFKLGFGAFGL